MYTFSIIIKKFPKIFFYIFTYIWGQLLFSPNYFHYLCHSPIFQKNSIKIFLYIYIKFGIVPPIYDIYDPFREGGYGEGGVLSPHRGVDRGINPQGYTTIYYTEGLYYVPRETILYDTSNDNVRDWGNDSYQVPHYKIQ